MKEQAITVDNDDESDEEESKYVELTKQISYSLQLSNKTDDYVAFEVKTTNPRKYCVRPNTGIVLPRSTCDIIALEMRTMRRDMSTLL
ncbi:hypothetical protein QN277_023091 [Acacia crassicarpa]|uniref:MSP domain-containing protein n=1 Tax=Acacia crassicarpa TaxID=499986 RepID=A0AAE1JKE5_9FABA|nr:hypothetical protein QN277_023091 [Acacia crassicarpa]